MQLLKQVLNKALGAILVVAPAVYGISTKAATQDNVDMTLRAAPCLACHDSVGREGIDGYYPRIAGKPARYLYNQLRNFRDGQRRFDPMNRLLAGLNDRYLMALARYFAQQPAKPIGNDTASTGNTRSHSAPAGIFASPNALSNRNACSNCHGNDLMGDGDAVPPLLGLPRDYINAQLGAWRNGTRRAASPDCMARVARSLKTSDISHISSWLAQQPLPGAPRAQADHAARHLDNCNTRANNDTQASQPGNTLAAEPSGNNATAAKGAYLARVANCTGCHTRAGQPLMSGDVPVKTPFGTVWATNLTPDPETGLGAWSADDFWQAIHQGKSRDGRLLYPAFPYPNYTAMRRADSDAIFAWLQTLPPVRRAPTPPDLAFPYNTRLALWAWRQLYFVPHRADSTGVPGGDESSATANRGAYLANVLGHCTACHATRNLLGGPAQAGRFDGEWMPGRSWFSPSLHAPGQAGVQHMTIDAISRLLQTGHDSSGQVTRQMTGPMGRIVNQSLQFLSDSDARAMATYLQRLPATPGDTSSGARDAPFRDVQSKAGASIYRAHCADCHGEDGRTTRTGEPAIVPLAGNSAVRHPNPANLVRVTLHGGYQPMTRRKPWPYGMPPFYQALSPQDTASVLSYIRQQWGNGAGPVSVRTVQQHR